MKIQRLSVTSSRLGVSDWFAHCVFSPDCVFLADLDVQADRVYRAPWRVAAGAADQFSIVHLGRRVLAQVRVMAWGSDAVHVSLPCLVSPGEVLTIEPPPETPSGTVVVRWREPDGTELLWPTAW